jgi:hypothetical protein
LKRKSSLGDQTEDPKRKFSVLKRLDYNLSSSDEEKERGRIPTDDEVAVLGFYSELQTVLDQEEAK